MGEMGDAKDAENGGQAQCNQHIDAAYRHAVDDLLQDLDHGAVFQGQCRKGGGVIVIFGGAGQRRPTPPGGTQSIVLRKAE